MFLITFFSCFWVLLKTRFLCFLFINVFNIYGLQEAQTDNRTLTGSKLGHAKNTEFQMTIILNCLYFNLTKNCPHFHVLIKRFNFNLVRGILFGPSYVGPSLCLFNRRRYYCEQLKMIIFSIESCFFRLSMLLLKTLEHASRLQALVNQLLHKKQGLAYTSTTYKVRTINLVRQYAPFLWVLSVLQYAKLARPSFRNYEFFCHFSGIFSRIFHV